MFIGVDGNEANVKNRVGSGQYAYELLKEFSKNEKHNFLVYLKEEPLSDLPEVNANFKYHIFGPKKFWTQIALPINLTFKKKPDVFFSPAHYGPRFSAVPYVVTIHDLSYLHFPELFKKNDLYQLTNWSKYSIHNAAHIIAPSQSTKDDIVKNYQVKPSQITVTYEGYDRTRFKPQPNPKIQKIKKKYKIKGDYIIFVGTLQPRKNIERLIEAFAIIVKNNTSGQSTVNIAAINNKARGTRDIMKHYRNNDFDSQHNNMRTTSRNTLTSRDTLYLVIVGKKGWLYDSILEKSKKLGIQSNVVFTDFVPGADLAPLISGSKVYVNPSLWEGFGIPVIEAQACGVPVVASNTSSLPEIVNPTPVILSEAKDLSEDNAVISGSGVLINPNSSESIVKGIQKVLTDEKTSSDLVKKGFENVKRFSWEVCASETIKVLESAAK